MSSTRFAPPARTTVDLPRLLLAERLTAGLAVAAAVALEASLGRHPDAPIGVGLVVAAILLLWHWRAVRRRPCAVRFECDGPSDRTSDGPDIRFTDAGWVPMAVGRQTRCLGPTLVLHWQASGRSGMLWLTPVDAPRYVLRRWAVRLTAGEAAARS